MSTGSGHFMSLSMPSMPAAMIIANARYGFASGSGERSSKRLKSPLAAGMRIEL